MIFWSDDFYKKSREFSRLFELWSDDDRPMIVRWSDDQIFFGLENIRSKFRLVGLIIWSSDDHRMTFCWSDDDRQTFFIFRWSSDHHLIIIWSSSDKKSRPMIRWWSSDHHLMIVRSKNGRPMIGWSSDFRKQLYECQFLFLPIQIPPNSIFHFFQNQVKRKTWVSGTQKLHYFRLWLAPTALEPRLNCAGTAWDAVPRCISAAGNAQMQVRAASQPLLLLLLLLLLL